jgi:hypothetical protein
MRPHFICTVLMLLAAALPGSLPAGAADSSVPTNSTTPRTDAHGNVIRHAPTGHVSNYDEAKVGTYTLPDPLVLQNGQPVRDAKTWYQQRRPELLKLYDTDIYGRVPGNAPKAMFKLLETDTNVMGGLATSKLVLMQLGDQPDAPQVRLHIYLPSGAKRPVPMLLQLVFFNNLPISGGASNPVPPNLSSRVLLRGEIGPITNILAHGYGYTTFRYTEVQPDDSNSLQSGVIGLTSAPNQTDRAPDDWGTISAWAWSASRVLDYFETDPAVDAKHVALIGHSRLGKTVLLAGARDPRFALVFSSCAGEMGASLARRDFGETIDDMAANFPWQFAVNFQKYAGHWNDMPVDTHMLIALNAPHPVFITGGTKDQWSDPRGEFLAEVAAGPVYRLVGKKDLGVTDGPPLDTPVITGDLGFNYHTGGHTITPSDWAAFLEFADRYLKPGGAAQSNAAR